jgi:hypothetical protein
MIGRCLLAGGGIVMMRRCTSPSLTLRCPDSQRRLRTFSGPSNLRHSGQRWLLWRPSPPKPRHGSQPAKGLRHKARVVRSPSPEDPDPTKRPATPRAAPEPAKLPAPKLSPLGVLMEWVHNPHSSTKREASGRRSVNSPLDTSIKHGRV